MRLQEWFQPPNSLAALASYGEFCESAYYAAAFEWIALGAARLETPHLFE